MIVVVGLASRHVSCGPGIQVICAVMGAISALARCCGAGKLRGAGQLRRGRRAAPRSAPGDCIVASASLRTRGYRPTRRVAEPDRHPSRRHPRPARGRAGPWRRRGQAALHQKTARLRSTWNPTLCKRGSEARDPMAAIRVITDPAGRALPKSALAACDRTGRPFPAIDDHLFKKSVGTADNPAPPALDARAARPRSMRGQSAARPRAWACRVQPLELTCVASLTESEAQSGEGTVPLQRGACYCAPQPSSA